jgi:hypothetical protein
MMKSFVPGHDPNGPSQEVSCDVEAFTDGAHLTVKRCGKTLAVLQYRIAIPEVSEGQHVLLQVLADLFVKLDRARAEQAPRIATLGRVNGTPANG